MTAGTQPITSRVAFAAAHVVPDVWAENVPGAPAVIDWESTLAFRHHLWSNGLGVAEAMDTAQRGMGMDWRATLELIQRSSREALSVGGLICAGAGTDHLAPGSRPTIAEIVSAYETQLSEVEAAGAQPILMASRHLAATAAGPDDYLQVYSALLRQATRPVILHWLGDMFDPQLAGYWGSTDPREAMVTVLQLIDSHAASIDGIKISLLDADLEKQLRTALPAGVRMYTGDDFNYPDLIRGDGTHHSDALLGAFAAIAPVVSVALLALDRGDLEAYDAAFVPSLPLVRHIFSAPTQYYKVGISFLAWLGGHQPGFAMVGGLQSGRSLSHLRTVHDLALEAELFNDPELARHRMNTLLELNGVIS